MTGGNQKTVGKSPAGNNTEEFHEQISKLMRLHASLSVSLAGSGPLRVILQTACQYLVDILDMASARVWLVDKPEQMLQLVASAGTSSELEGEGRQIPIGDSTIGQIVSRCEALLTNDPIVGNPPWLEDDDIVSFGGFPLLVESRVIGVLTLSADHEISPDIFEQLRPMAEVLAQFIARKESEQNKMDQDDAMQLAFDAGRLGTWRWDIVNDQIIWSAQLYELFGYTKEQFSPTCEGFVSIIHPDDRVFVRERLGMVFTGTCETYTMEFRIIRGDDQRVVWTFGRGVISRDEQNRPLAITAVASDITDRKALELQLAEREADLRRVIDNMLGFVGVLATDGTLLDANMATLAGGGVTREDVIGKKFWDCYWWDFDREAVLRLKDSIQRAAAGELVRYDAQMRMAGDTRLMIDFMLVPVRDDSGTVTHLIPSGIDITERKLAEAAARQREQHLNLALEAGRMGSWEWNIVEDRITWSDHLYELFGYGRDEFKKTAVGFLEIVIPEDRGIVEAVIDSIMHTNSQREEFECRAIRGTDGQQILVQCHGIVDRDIHGTPLRITGFAVDITERKRRELNIAFLADLQAALAPLTSVEEISGTATKRINEYLELSHCMLVDLDESTATAVVFHDYCNDDQPSLVGVYAMGDFFDEDERHQLVEGGVLIENDTRSKTKSTAAADQFASLQTGAFVSAAYVSDQRIEFMLTAMKQRAYQWRSDEVQLLRDVVGNLHLRLERARADAALRESEEFNRTIIESSPDCVNVLDLEGRLVSMNTAGIAAFEIADFATLKGKDWGSLWPEESRTLAQRALDDAKQIGKGSFQTLCRTASGISKWWDVLVTPVRDSSQRVVRLVAVSRDVTEQKHWETDLRDREAHLRRVINNQLGLVGVIDRDGILVEVDDDSISIAGVTREDVIGKHFADCVWWTYDEAVSRKMRESMEKAFAGEIVRYDVPLYAAGNQRLMIDFMIAPVHDEEGQVTYLIPSAVDISDRVKAEQAQKDDQQRLKMALSAGGMAAWEWTPSKSVWTDALYEMLGLSTDVIAAPETFFELVHEEDRAGLIKAWQEATSGEKPYSHEFRVLRSSGEIRWLAGMGEVERNEAGDVKRIYGLNWDITERKKADLRRIKTANLEHFLLEASTVLTSSLDYEQTLASVTDLCVPTLADWAFIDLVNEEGQTRRVHVAHADPADRDLAAEVVKFAARPDFSDHPPARALFAGETVLIPEFSEEMLRKAARNKEHEDVMRAVGPKSLIVVPLISRKTCLGALTLITSDSGRRYAKADLKIAKELAQQAATAVDNARLFNAAQQANIAKSEFLANMSHEIRTPMTAVLGYAELLRERIDDPEADQHLAIIRRNGEFLLDIINDILDLSKIEAGKLEVATEKFALARLVEDVRSVMEVRAKESGLRLEVEYLSRVPAEIESDPKRLKQVLINLVGNAIKFTREGKVRLEVLYNPRDQQPLHIKIVDTGIGIALEKQKKLFKPFSQGDASVTREFGGTGLGLAISRRLANLLGGNIVAKSSVDQGSEFTLSLSVGDISDVPIVYPNAMWDASEEVTPAKAIALNSHILIVDDRRDILFLSKRLLTKAGATVAEAADGILAVEHIREGLDSGQLPDLILLDMQMPNLDGYQTAQQVRSMGYQGPIIALTADAMQGDMKRCIECGCNAYLSKPIDATRLIELVHELTRDESTN